MDLSCNSINFETGLLSRTDARAAIVPMRLRIIRDRLAINRSRCPAPCERNDDHHVMDAKRPNARACRSTACSLTVCVAKSNVLPPRSKGWERLGRRRSPRKRLWAPRHCSGFWQHRVISREVVDEIDVSVQGRWSRILGNVLRCSPFVAESVAARGGGEKEVGLVPAFFVSG